MNIDYKKGDGLVPAIVQNADTEQVLMLGYMDEAALQATRETGFVTFFSRSRQMLWQKGETSGDTLSLISIDVDCDADTLLVRARPNGPTCHKGTISCFGADGPQGLGFLAELATLIEERKKADPETSYSASLLQGEISRAAQKVGEEGVETVIAALAQSDAEFIAESADLIYHLMILLAAKNLSIADVVNELKARRKK
jgi:phosphoribosyl-ATP pyrophosphohydrolase/phosphoribosyl-AMP cyclohydrolase